jgi:hypothetical protein
MNINIKNSEIDRLMRQALESSDEFVVPGHVIDLTMRKLEKRMLLRQLLMELFIKIGLGLGSLGVLACVLALSIGLDMMKRLYAIVQANMQLVVILLTATLLILIIDQIALRFYIPQKPDACRP